MSEFLNPRRLARLRTQAFAWETDGTGGAKVGRWLADCAPELIRALGEANAALARARTAAEPIRAGLADAEEAAERPGDIGLSWYGHVDLDDVRALVAVLDQPGEGS